MISKGTVIGFQQSRLASICSLALAAMEALQEKEVKSKQNLFKDARYRAQSSAQNDLRKNKKSPS